MVPSKNSFSANIFSTDKMTKNGKKFFMILQFVHPDMVQTPILSFFDHNYCSNTSPQPKETFQRDFEY